MINKKMISKKVAFTFLLFFFIGITLAQNKKTCDVLSKTIEKYKSNFNAFTIKYTMTSGGNDTSRVEGNLYYNNVNSSQPPYYFLQCGDNFIYFNNSKYYGLNNLKSNEFIDLSEKDSSKLIKGNTVGYLIPSFLMYHPFLQDYIDGCNSNTVLFTENDKSYIISIPDYTKVPITANGIIIGTSNYNLVYIEIDKKTFLIKNHYSEIQYIMGGVETKQIETLTFEPITIPKEEIIAKIENEKPFKKKYAHPNDSISKGIPLGSKFPNFNLKDLNNNNFGDGLIKSRYVLVEFWYKSCAPCIVNLQQLNKIDSVYSKKDLTILAINDIDTGLVSLNRFIKKFNLNYFILFQGKSLAEKFNIRSHPQTFIYDNKDRKIVYSSIGGGDSYAEKIKKAFDDILKKETDYTSLLLMTSFIALIFSVVIFKRIKYGKNN